MRDVHEQGYGLRSFYRDPLFDKTLAELRAQGGYAAVASVKAEELIGILTGTNPADGRARFARHRRLIQILFQGQERLGSWFIWNDFSAPPEKTIKSLL